ncbi:mucin-5AC-like isoform X2 [Aricia agestis]|uniref:mucin-5AC-like isoform X2 n=1 Tax=Aricia agestis TaxID=91739 RepID=UPI001C202572|nr:mucin-5AC-like isoform X2 [Aricia agestis]
MSGKPASVGAGRAGGAGAPRVLVYVAEARQLEAAAAGPDPPPLPHPPLDARYLHDNLPQQLSLSRTSVYRSPPDAADQRGASGFHYKHFNDIDSRVNAYGASNSILASATDVYPQFLKESRLQSEDNIDEVSSDTILKRECGSTSDWDSGDAYHVTIPDTRDVASYRGRCQGNPDSMSSVQVNHGSSLYTENGVVQSDGEGIDCNDRESINKSFVNYQLLEQSESHQSIVNQSINILNQQVGVSRSLVSEASGGGGAQLVRTAEGVVLAVLPPSSETEVRAVQCEPQTITVPLGWRRIVNGTSVVYISPSGTALSTLPQLRDYLQTAGTCKCGLPCPLRPETAFNFDPKVVSKPYQASGAESGKLCNHKRKLLATLQSRAQSPAASPPPTIEQKKGPGAEATKKKMKKRAGFAANMSVSQMMVQRERPHSELKGNENEQKMSNSFGVTLQRAGNAQPNAPYAQNMNVQEDIKQESHVQRGPHYLTVNSGWITQHPENIDVAQKTNAPGLMNALSVGGMPVLGTNGQIIGVNTGYNKHAANKNIVTVTQQNTIDQDQKSEEKDMLQSVKRAKDEEPQIFCGLNQPLTPEVMKKINEQQQIFIQRNQKQIEVMKGYKSQATEGYPNKSQGQFPPQGQLVIQNGAVMKTSSVKTPPWQVKRNDLLSPNPKQLKTEGDHEDAVPADDGGAMTFANDQMGPGMCSRVPPLPQHYSAMGPGQQWNNMDASKKKTKGSKGGKKKSIADNKLVFNSSGARYLQDGKTKACEDMIGNNLPSFMDDPNGYLAQQTVLLNNTISRQVGLNATFEGNHTDSSSLPYASMHQIDKTKNLTKAGETVNTFRNNMVSNASPSPNNTPDSSLASVENSQCCKGCNPSIKGGCTETEHLTRHKYVKQPTLYNLESDGGVLGMSSPKSGFDENPVTSSTFIDRGMMMNENYGPIQAGIVSTSNVSPETLQQPEPSPTLSNSSRSTDTPQSSQGNNSHVQNNCSYPLPSPAFPNPGPGRDHFNSNPSTPGSNPTYPYNSPGPPSAQPLCGNQMMHFISNHNVNKNLMEVDNISMVGVRPALKNQEMLKLDSKKRMENNMPGYCPPPHLGGGPAHSLIQTYYVQTFVTTMASGFSVTRDTVTSVLAGKANTATTSINSSQANFVRPPPPPSVNLATTYAIPNNQPDPFFNSVNLPTSYPLHIAGTRAQNMISKSPLEMVQNVISSLPTKPETSVPQTVSTPPKRTCSTPGQILISSTGQILVSNNTMPPPPPKNSSTSPVSSSSTSVATSVTHVPGPGGVPSLVNPPTVVVNTLPAPFVIPPMMAVDGQVVQQNNVLPQMVAGGLVSSHHSNDNSRQVEVKNGQTFVQGVAMLSPESIKRRSKKKKSTSTNITNVLQITAPQQTSNNIMVHHTSPQHNSNPQFSPRGFQLSPTNNISPTPMLQALTIVPGKSGTPAHIVMNGQGAAAGGFPSQQIITNTSPSQPINLLQPVNLINNASNMMSNFPAFQQFILPNLSGMVVTPDGTIIQDNSTGMPMQLQLQTVNGQNVLTPVQNTSVFPGANSGVVIRAQNQSGKIIQSQHSPGAQFLSPNSQVMVNSPNFNGQLSPLLANLSPTSVTFNTSPHQVRSGNVQTQEFIQTNQMGQTLVVPLSPSKVSANGNRSNSTFVQQNTTIVQQQTTLVSNSQNTQMSAISTNLSGGNSSRMSVDHNAVATQRPATNQRSRNFVQIAQENQIIETKEEKHYRAQSNETDETNSEAYKFLNDFNALDGINSVRHSVSTQTLVNQQRGKSPSSQAVSGSSPPDTTTHSPLGALETAASPRLYGPRCVSTQGNYADTTTKSPEPNDVNSSGMVQCVSSSEQDMAESRERTWAAPRADNTSDTESHNMMSNIQLMRLNRHLPVESTEYGQANSQALPVTSHLYDRHGYKRKNDFGDGSSYRTDKIMRTNYTVGAKNVYDLGNPQDKRHYAPGNSAEGNKVYDRHLGPRDGAES